MIFVVTLQQDIDFVQHNNILVENMENHKVALFDLDGVVLNTECQYTDFWAGMGEKYFHSGMEFANMIKGSTLVQIMDKHFKDDTKVQQEITAALDDFEKSMAYDYIEGFPRFISDIRNAGIKTAVVTSSNIKKMENVYRAHPEFKSLFDAILTSEDFEHSKPHPDCYFKGAKRFGVQPDMCVGFEDSINGLKAVKAAGMYCVGLETTNPHDVVAKYADLVVDNYLDANNTDGNCKYNKLMELFV